MLFGAYGTGARPVLKINSSLGEAGIGGYYSQPLLITLPSLVSIFMPILVILVARHLILER